MIIGKIENGIVLDHIKAGHRHGALQDTRSGQGDWTARWRSSRMLKAKKWDARISSRSTGRMDINLDAIGYVDPGITVNFIENGKLAKRTHIDPPEKIVDVIRCKNPRCITTVEQEIPHIFRLTDKANGIYRCIYCESKAK